MPSLIRTRSTFSYTFRLCAEIAPAAFHVEEGMGRRHDADPRHFICEAGGLGHVRKNEILANRKMLLISK